LSCSCFNNTLNYDINILQYCIQATNTAERLWHDNDYYIAKLLFSVPAKEF